MAAKPMPPAAPEPAACANVAANSKPDRVKASTRLRKPASRWATCVAVAPFWGPKTAAAPVGPIRASDVACDDELDAVQPHDVVRIDGWMRVRFSAVGARSSPVRSRKRCQGGEHADAAVGARAPPSASTSWRRQELRPRGWLRRSLARRGHRRVAPVAQGAGARVGDFYDCGVEVEGDHTATAFAGRPVDLDR